MKTLSKVLASYGLIALGVVTQLPFFRAGDSPAQLKGLDEFAGFVIFAGAIGLLVRSI